MFDSYLRRIAPPIQPEVDFLEPYRVTQQFYREVQLREEFEQYCQWYEAIAEQHRQEFQAMQQEINLFGWFCRRGR